MKLARIVDTDIADPWVERRRMVRSALDCFAPIAITIRANPNTLGPNILGFSAPLDYPNGLELQAKHSRPR